MSGDVGMTIRQAAEKFAKMKGNTDDRDCMRIITDLLKLFVHFPTFLDPTAQSPTRPQEVALVRDALEEAVLVAVRMKDVDLFEGYYAQLRTYYVDMASGDKDVPESERRLLILGLNLVRLLVCQKISEFHTELEAIPYASHNDMFIRTPILLERYLMEGSYNRLLHARSQVPSNAFLPLVDMLQDTVRRDIAQCIPVTYPRLSVAAAQKMLMLSDAAATEAFAAEREWTKSADGTAYVFETADDTATRREIPFKSQVMDNIGFAAQLQSVV